MVPGVKERVKCESRCLDALPIRISVILSFSLLSLSLSFPLSLQMKEAQDAGNAATIAQLKVGREGAKMGETDREKTREREREEERVSE